MSVDEAIKVLQGAATTRRAQTALSMLQSEIEATDRGRGQEKSSGEPKFPDAKLIAELDAGEQQQRQGQPQPAGARGSDTARKGS